MSKDTELSAETTTEGRENLKLWKSVEKTPPDMTKLVSFGKRKYTTIDPQWQLRVATALWGPYGHRWGMRNLDCKLVETHDGDEKGRFMLSNVLLKAEFFYPVDGGEASFEIWNDDRWRAGDDTLKKLITNTRSKALSWLGFSADVFLGKFDDASYVETARAKFSKQNSFAATAAAKIMDAKTLDDLASFESKLSDVAVDQAKDVDAIVIEELRELIEERRQAISERIRYEDN